MSRRVVTRGAAAVEFALVLPLLMLLVLGALDWGYYFYVEQIVINATREGARAGSLHTNAGDAVTDAQTTAVNYLTLAGLDGTRATVTVTTGADDVSVQVSFPVGSLTGFTDIVVPDAARGSAMMRR